MTEYRFKPILLDLLRQAQFAQDTFLQELNANEYAAIGTPEYWSAKDHIAHMTFWRQRLVLSLTAILRQETPQDSEDIEQFNRQVFEQQRERPWSEIRSESAQAYTELLTCTQQLSEEDLTATNRFTWIPEGNPLYTSFMGNCYEHTQQHLAQYYLDRHDLPQARRTYEIWASRVLEAEVPPFLRGYVLYNLACFYATHTELEKASEILQQALTLAPSLKAFALTDSDLVELRNELA
jgi:tetratricopeptide (TPR) repeat protein